VGQKNLLTQTLY